MAKKNRASEQSFGELHKQVTEELAWQMSQNTDPKGNRIPVNPATLKLAMDWLKINDVVREEEESDELKQLTSSFMPFKTSAKQQAKDDAEIYN